MFYLPIFTIDHTPSPSDICIPDTWICDGIADCPGSLDELDCTMTNVTCEEQGLWTCPSDGTTCISHLVHLCDGKDDCPGSEDELDEICDEIRKGAVSFEFAGLNLTVTVPKNGTVNEEALHYLGEFLYDMYISASCLLFDVCHYRPVGPYRQ